MGRRSVYLQVIYNLDSCKLRCALFLHKLLPLILNPSSILEDMKRSKMKDENEKI